MCDVDESCPWFFIGTVLALSLISFSVNENSSAKSKNGVALMSDYTCLQKMKKGTLFYQLALVPTSHKTEKGTLFLSILLSLKNIGKGVKFQDITPIRATFTNTLANDINNGYPFSELTG